MINIEKIFFCDDIKEGQFGKLNIYGFNPTQTLSLDKLPYLFVTKLVISGKANERLNGISLEVILEDNHGNVLSRTNEGIPENSQQITDLIPIFFIHDYKILIKDYGKLIIRLIRQGNILYEEKFLIVKGISPNIYIKDRLPQSKLFTGNQKADLDFVIDLLAIASKSLRIFDPHINSPDVLNAFLSRINNSIIIQLITGTKYKGNFQLNKLKLNFPNLELKFCDRSHDRFIIINNSEYFHFGHSFKDIANKRLSRCSKIIDKSEIIEIESFFNDVWQNN